MKHNERTRASGLSIPLVATLLFVGLMTFAGVMDVSTRADDNDFRLTAQTCDPGDPDCLGEENDCDLFPTTCEFDPCNFDPDLPECTPDGSETVDTDGDGVPDATDPDRRDPCIPSTDAAACDADADGIKAGDQCPSATEDFDGIGDQDGCPEVDYDSDGVPDVRDACPQVAAPGTLTGCASQPTSTPSATPSPSVTASPSPTSSSSPGPSPTASPSATPSPTHSPTAGPPAFPNPLWVRSRLTAELVDEKKRRPRIIGKVTLGAEFAGLDGLPLQCLSSREVTLKRQRPGPNRVVKSVTANDAGEFFIATDHLDKSYYLVLRGQTTLTVEGHRIECLGFRLGSIV